VIPHSRTFVCETCSTCKTVPVAERETAVARARSEGWTVDYQGPGHGSVAWCPAHAEDALRVRKTGSAA
jgi:hypothetical protein